MAADRRRRAHQHGNAHGHHPRPAIRRDRQRIGDEPIGDAVAVGRGHGIETVGEVDALHAFGERALDHGRAIELLAHQRGDRPARVVACLAHSSRAGRPAAWTHVIDVHLVGKDGELVAVGEALHQSVGDQVGKLGAPKHVAEVRVGLQVEGVGGVRLRSDAVGEIAIAVRIRDRQAGAQPGDQDGARAAEVGALDAGQRGSCRGRRHVVVAEQRHIARERVAAVVGDCRHGAVGIERERGCGEPIEPGVAQRVGEVAQARHGAFLNARVVVLDLEGARRVAHHQDEPERKEKTQRERDQQLDQREARLAHRGGESVHGHGHGHAHGMTV